MRTSNIALMALAASLSIALLWLWFYLGFNQVDSPFDLILVVVWWVVIAAGVLWIRRVEKQRQIQRRTTYVADEFLFNPEAGMLPAQSGKTGAQVADAVQGILENLQYGFQVQEAPEGCEKNITHIVRSETFQVECDGERAEGSSPKRIVEWMGEVAVAGRPDLQPKPFSSKEELAALLS